MDDLTLSGIVLGLLITLLLFRVPVGVALGGLSFAGIWVMLGSRTAWGILTAVPYDFISHWTLSSVPMFLLMGYICFHSQLTDGLFRVARSWLSWMPGGLAVASVGAAAGFSAVTGSSLACAAAMGRIAIPEMLRSGYDKGLASGTVAVAGTIGSMIPPSILLLVYGIYAQLPISQLFLAGVVPGILTAVLYAAMIIVRVKLNPKLAPAVTETVSWRDRFEAFRGTWPVIALIVGVFGGLFGGIFTPTEAGGIGALLSFVIGFAQRTLTWKKIKLAITETLITTGSIFIIAVGAILLTRFLALSGFTGFIAEVVVDGQVSPFLLVLGTMAVLLFLGCFLDPIGIMLLTLPVFLPAVEGLHINLIWYGIILTKLLEIGLITPPVGLNVFVIKGIVGDAIPIETIFKGILWFLVADVLCVVLLVTFPQISLYLPGLLG
ncbi:MULTISPECIES: TRAP transporter large permease [Rhodopseudomonas]|uniref:TRAP transporter large permease protein n=1 Tax=Rhodopseudomonas palustris TaxID=1076 RepID=A0A0D7F539_RHOPL|nr:MULTISPECIES: TRAP transporter large permease [Rhodopseudomonas]KIZ46847.1 C4-dicarboxylate ABC transporter [Rhodopseudomonas palustris]MDF3813541.1 TRAP transporter large permease [Rhodopseudomonas sp. BAL398]WOK15388.1 TRAP transporter large permease [Rhodopseudomonas sp. BAL398]